MKLPIFVEASGLRVLVVGGGEEGYKKSLRFLRAGAEVMVLSKEFVPELEDLASREERIRLVRDDASDARLLEDLIRWCDIAISALGDAYSIDTTIIELSRRHRKLFILAGDAGRTQCGMGIEGSSGDIRFAIYTDGKSSLVAMEARDRIAKFLDEQKDLHAMLALLHRMKRLLREAGVPSDLRVEIHRKIFRDRVFRDLAASGDLEKAWERIRSVVAESAGVDLGGP